MEIKTKNKEKLLVVGGTGYIGHNILKKSLKLGFITTSLSKKIPKKNSRIDGIKYIVADITKAKQLKLKLNYHKFDYVINSSGYIDHSKYSKEGNKVLNLHFDGLKNLINSLLKKNIKRFIHLGSTNEYGWKNSKLQNEEQKESSISMYTCAKIASTYFLQTLFVTENFPAVILRPSRVYGSQMRDNGVISQIIHGCIKNKNFPISKGDQLRDFLYIDDFIDAIFIALKSKKAIGEIINISSGKPIRIKKIVNTIVKITKSGKPKFGKIKFRKDESLILYADIKKAKKLLNWKPKVDFNTGIRKTIKDIRINNL